MQILFPSSLIMMLTGRLANANDAPLSNNLRGLQNLPWKNGKDSSGGNGNGNGNNGMFSIPSSSMNMMVHHTIQLFIFIVIGMNKIFKTL